MENGTPYVAKEIHCTRPLSILQIRSDACAKYALMKQTKLIGMLTPMCKLILEILCITYYSQ